MGKKRRDGAPKGATATLPMATIVAVAAVTAVASYVAIHRPGAALHRAEGRALMDAFGKLDLLPRLAEDRIDQDEDAVEIGHDFASNMMIKEASDAYRRAVHIDPTNMEAYHWLAQLHSSNRQIGPPHVAERALHVLLRDSPRGPHGTDTRTRLSRVLFQEGRYMEAAWHAAEAVTIGKTAGGNAPETAAMRLHNVAILQLMAGSHSPYEEEPRKALENAVQLSMLSPSARPPPSAACARRELRTSWVAPPPGAPAKPGVVSVTVISEGGASYGVAGYEDVPSPTPARCPNLDAALAGERKLP